MRIDGQIGAAFALPNSSIPPSFLSVRCSRAGWGPRIRGSQTPGVAFSSRSMTIRTSWASEVAAIFSITRAR
jgi:hypothetical protein